LAAAEQAAQQALLQTEQTVQILYFQLLHQQGAVAAENVPADLPIMELRAVQVAAVAAITAQVQQAQPIKVVQVETAHPLH
jgi:hypothetical protein